MARRRKTARKTARTSVRTITRYVKSNPPIRRRRAGGGSRRGILYVPREALPMAIGAAGGLFAADWAMQYAAQRVRFLATPVGRAATAAAVGIIGGRLIRRSNPSAGTAFMAVGLGVGAFGLVQGLRAKPRKTRPGAATKALQGYDDDDMGYWGPEQRLGIGYWNPGQRLGEAEYADAELDAI